MTLELVESTFWLPTAEIWVEPTFNCRESVSIISVEDLARSIEARGLRFPVVVQPREDVTDIPDGYNYRLIVGFRRFTAVSKVLNQTQIKGVIRRGLSQQEARIENLLENVDRKNLNMLEEARALASIYPPGTTLAIAADGLKKHPRWCSVRYHLLKMAPVIQEAAANGLLTQSDVQMIASVAANCQLDVFKRIIEQKAITKKPWRPAKIEPRPSGEIIKERMEMLVHGGIGGFIGRLLLWAADGSLPSDVIDQEIQQILDRHAAGSLSKEELIGAMKEEEDANDVPQQRVIRH